MADTASVRILLIEDSPLDAELLQALIRTAAFHSEFFLVRDPVSFKRILDTHDFDLILADHNLGTWTARDAMEILMQSDIDIPIIIVTGILGDERAVEYVKAGAFDYVLKDNLERLIPAIARAVREKEQRIENVRLQQANDLASRELRERQAILRTLVQTLPDLVWLKNPAGVYLSCNTRFEEFLGANASQILGKTDDAFLSEEAVALNREYDLKAIAAGHPCSNEEWLTFAKTGYKGLFETLRTPVKDSDGNLIGVVGIARDITMRHEAEQQQRIAAYAFQAQEAIIIADGDRIIRRVNEAFCEMTGYTPEEVLGQNTTMLHSGTADSTASDLMWESVEADGLWKGELIHARKGGEPFPGWVTVTRVKDNEGKTTHYVWMMLDITERKAAAAEIEHLAFYDPLTQLPNRRLLLDRLRHALSTANRVRAWSAVYFIDLDNFKLLNDTQGHDVGDHVLIEVAQRLSRCVRAGDTVARFGGDEFVVLTEYLSKDAGAATALATHIAEKMKSALADPFKVGRITHHATASIGASLWSDPAASVEAIIKQADIAMYHAKANGRDTISFFNPAMEADVGERAELLQDIRAGIRQREFVLHFQPQVDVDQNVVGAEALVRWNHPTRGLLLPARFIPLAEESDLILPLGELIMHSACSTLAAWSRSQNHLRDLDLSVNVSARQFRHPDFIDSIARTLRDTRAPASHLLLEITESMMVSDLSSTIEKMNQVAQLGVRFSLDDFGTGFSSLSCLTRFPLSQLKIDRTFIMRLPGTRTDRAIVQTILALGKNLGLVVVAEGVEKHVHREFLERNGTAILQGYLFGRPMDEMQFEQQVLSAQRSRTTDPERRATKSIRSDVAQ